MIQFLVLLLYGFSVSSQNPELLIPQGRLRGASRTNIDGNTYYSYQNIPYAQPPIGKLRFKSPLPDRGWEGIRDATEDVPQCLQLVSDPENVKGQEDCLYLNVYIPHLPNNATKKPVMVYIHGGAFNTKSATETEFGGQFLLTRNVILVVINYRLGIFGFANLDDPDLGVPGNAGMKDQVLALNWVQNNIEYFGGDPNNVLLFGESAGGMSVHFHVVSSMSEGLFHKVILQSGVALSDFVVPQFRENIFPIAELLNIDTANRSTMLESLQNETAENIAIADAKLTEWYPYISRPIVEIPTNEEAFLSDHPLNIVRSGNYNQIPMIVGFNDAEGLRHEFRARKLTGESVLITDFVQFVPHLEPSRDNITSAVNLYGDFEFNFPAYRTTLEHLNTAENPIYFYYFAADTKLNRAKLGSTSIAIDYPGTAHGDELGYIFSYAKMPEISVGSVEDLRIRDMVELWTNFAIYDNPTPDSFDEFKWEPVGKEQFNYLHVDTEKVYFVSDKTPIPERFEFWTAVYEKYVPNN